MVLICKYGRREALVAASKYAQLPTRRRTLYTQAVAPLQHLHTGPPPFPRPSSPRLESSPTSQHSPHTQSQQALPSSHALPLGLLGGEDDGKYPLHVPPNKPLLQGPSSPFLYNYLPISSRKPSLPSPPSYLQFAPSASGIPKCRKHMRKTANLPHDEDDTHLAVQVGEDAYFLRPDALGVADGVGGWSSQRTNADSALFSRRLMHFCSQEAAASSSSDPDPVAVLSRAYAHALTAFATHNLVGSSTALLALLPPNSNKIHIAHLGDCAVFLLRSNLIIYRSEEMQHSFNYPLQLGPLSPTKPENDAQRIVLDVEDGDVVVLATDGMADNLWDEDVLEEAIRLVNWADIRQQPVSTTPPTSSSHAQLHASLLPTLLSSALCNRAKRASQKKVSKTSSKDEDVEVPFARRAKEEGIQFVGGKPDDITVVVALISNSSPVTSIPYSTTPLGGLPIPLNLPTTPQR